MSLIDSISPLIRICRYSGLAPFSMVQSDLMWSTALKRLSNTFTTVVILLIHCNSFQQDIYRSFTGRVPYGIFECVHVFQPPTCISSSFRILHET